MRKIIIFEDKVVDFLHERKTCAGNFFKPYHFALKPVKAEKNIIFRR